VLVIDENISEIEVWRLREWGVVVRQIGPAKAQLVNLPRQDRHLRRRIGVFGH
jgi:hypothetical protein